MRSRKEVESWLQERIAKEMKTSAQAIPVNVPFTNFGLDSIMIVTLAVDLEKWLNLSLDPTIFWEFPSIEALTTWLMNEHLSS